MTFLRLFGMLVDIQKTLLKKAPNITFTTNTEINKWRLFIYYSINDNFQVSAVIRKLLSILALKRTTEKVNFLLVSIDFNPSRKKFSK